MKLEIKQTLSYYLSKSTIPQLKTIAKKWELKGLSSLKKAELIAKLETCIKENIKENSKSWSTESLDIITSLVQNNGIITLSQSNDSYDFLEKLGIIHKEIEENKFFYLLSTDLTDEFSIDIADEVAATVENVQPFINRSPIVGTTPRHVIKISRNAPCPCGSGIKYKFCCGK